MLSTAVAYLAVVAAPIQSPGCAAPNRSDESLVMHAIENVIRIPSWHGLDFSSADTLSIRSVHSDSLCILALQTINQFLLPSGYKIKQIRLVIAGKYYVAQQAPEGPTHSEFYPEFILDSSLKHVAFPCKPDGTANC